MRLKIIPLAGLALAAAALPVASFAGGTRVGVSIGIGIPAFGYPPPVAYVPPPPVVYVPPAPVFFPPPAVVYAPPVAVVPGPFYAAPRVVFRAGGFHGGPGYHGYGTGYYHGGRRWH